VVLTLDLGGEGGHRGGLVLRPLRRVLGVRGPTPPRAAGGGGRGAISRARGDEAGPWSKLDLKKNGHHQPRVMQSHLIKYINNGQYNVNMVTVQ